MAKTAAKKKSDEAGPRQAGAPPAASGARMAVGRGRPVRRACGDRDARPEAATAYDEMWFIGRPVSS